MKGSSACTSRVLGTGRFRSTAILAFAALIGLACNPSDLFAQEASREGLGVRTGYEFEHENALVGLHGSFKLISDVSRIQPEFTLGFGGDRTSLLAVLHFQRVFNASGELPFYIGGAFGYFFEEDSEREGDASVLVGGVERPLGERLFGFIESQWVLIEGPNDANIKAGLTYRLF